ncbi:unnamed protein product [Schistosoma margrebowiei]|uniref:Uncharacterized protein n=1 Tax=Schistosoma margrebowiei TaxID=48269 RepID=A0A183MHS7_9TREM|nr:unnamed protein product [Schistosoma margrebowiei]
MLFSLATSRIQDTRFAPFVTRQLDGTYISDLMFTLELEPSTVRFEDTTLPNEVDSAATAAATIAAAALASRQQQHQQQQHYQNINQNLQNSGSAFVSLAYASCKLKYDLFISNNFSSYIYLL